MNKWIWLSVMLAFVVGLGVAWYLLSPLLFDDVVDEQLPTIAEVSVMAPEEKRRVMDGVMARMAKMDAQEISEAMPEAPSVKRAGPFNGADALHKAQGLATHYRLVDGSELLRFENFEVTNGPALVVYLVQHPDPKTSADVEAGFISLGPLKGNKGNQNYRLPSGLDVTDYKSAIIWCELFGVLFASAALKEPEM